MKQFFKKIAAGVDLATAMAAPAFAQSQPSILVVTHGQASDPFWSIVKNGAMQAAKDTGVKVE